jgi:2,4'-dihydroxyacetophenone dioxygenase
MDVTQLMRADRAIGADAVPWVPLAPGVEYRPLRFDLSTGTWANVLRVRPGAGLGRHRHHGGPVMGYIIAGRWWYLERDWVATAGTWVWEPPGDIHTLATDADEGMTAVFVTDGVLQFFDADGGLDHEDTVFTRYQGYVDHCERLGIDVVDLVY